VEWERLNPHDRVIPAVVADPGRPKLFHSPTLFAGRSNRPMRDFTKRAGWQMSMVTAFLAPHGRNAQWVSLYRPNADHPYSEDEQCVARFLMPHLVEALTINRSLYSQSAYDEDADRGAFVALCDRTGMVHYADAGFVSTVADEWPGFDGGNLPENVVRLVHRGRRLDFVGRKIRLECRAHDGFLFLRARPKTLVDSLSPKQAVVAREYANGRSHKEIAKLLGMAPATVRHHLSGVYSKLDIHGKAQLAVVLHATGRAVRSAKD
jgi:DNA-binding CsgD family transcriptional regulator